ncbi:helix-turn-helix domain-containing protein [Phycisphaera mikurensis]|uniref:Putative Xre family transcriptional regulator n=1 Tax=Phycisphaera mikurensis (strain NBRC 102666 / KCTC 22515 / FYK2301M01) TaxID=1142394 RepID=I0IB00_PHYMF|nr:XRE family transcriptional regulator [Phycisphaera mikurensis]MBB6442590.1 Zn-dependent peptidase ImmA (M78 family)/DNA-binding XRE family transcriptional regulator [Phycisphaera mikurensis]BAM02438.1 putative Xre family transcriptional regulator [Phycisphaera mikurensis NBRC 102666]
MEGFSGFNPAMLTAAREAQRLTQTALARLLGVSQPLVARWEAAGHTEAGDREPDLVQRRALAEALRVHPRLFAQPGSAARASESEYFHRAFAKARRTDVKAAHARCGLIELQADRLLDLEGAPEDRIPEIDPENHAGDAEKIAGWARTRMGLAPGPVDNLVRTVEDCGGLVIDHDLEIDNVDALCHWRPGLPKLFFLNGNRPGDRMRLSLAHELGHTVMHLGRDTELKLAEEQAQRFAAAFLLPSADFRPDLTFRLDLSRLMTLKRKWRVSMQAIAYRAHQLGAIDQTRFRSLFQQISRKGWRKTEPVEVRRESPMAFKRLLRAHVDAGFTREDLAMLLLVPPARVDEMLVDASSPDWEDGGVRLRLAR